MTTRFAHFTTSAVRNLRRTTTSGQFLAEIDGLRFVAICSVIVFHVSGYLVVKSPVHAPTASQNWLAIIARTGHCGVPLFFMISGFILAVPWLKAGAPSNLRGYFLRRLTRLEPPYFVSLVGMTLAYYATRHPPASELVRDFLASTFYLHGSIFGTVYPANCVTWSLEMEIQFYAALPILAYLLFRTASHVRQFVLCALIVLGCCVSYGVRDVPRLSLSVLCYSQYFLTGIFIADLRRGWLDFERSWWWDCLGLTGFALVPVADLRWHDAVFPPVLLFLALIFISALRGRLVGRLLSNQLIVIIGGMCYSIYLLHFPLISFLGKRTITWGERLAFPAYLLVQLVTLSFLMLPIIITFFVCLERPCMNREWPRRVLALAQRFGRQAPSH